MTDTTLPLYGRASDIRTLTLGSGCEGQWALNHLYRDQLPDAVWFILGTAVHETIERVILEDLTLGDALADVQVNIELGLGSAENGVIESASKRSKRGLDTIRDDATSLVAAWFKDVHPDSPDRNPIFNMYEWPPQVEFEIEVPDIGLYTTVDAIFTGKPGAAPFGQDTLIVDWKTGNSRSSHESQLQIYMYGLRRMGLLPDTVIMPGGFWHVAHSKMQMVDYYVGDDIVRQWIGRTEQNKKDLVEWGPTFVPDWWCGFCVAKSKCPIWGKGDVEEIGIDVGNARLLLEPEREEPVCSVAGCDLYPDSMCEQPDRCEGHQQDEWGIYAQDCECYDGHDIISDPPEVCYRHSKAWEKEKQQ